MYTDYSPLSVIRDRAFDVDNYLTRLQWFIEEMMREKSEFGLPLFTNFSNLLPFGLSTCEINVNSEVEKLENRRQFNTKMITDTLKRTQVCLCADEKRWSNKQYR